MKEEAEELAVKLKHIFGDRVECRFVDVKTSAIKNHPEIEKIINQVLLPMTVIDGKPRLHGYIDQDLIIDAVKQQLNNTENLL